MNRRSKHPARELRSPASIALIIIACLVLGACESTGGGYSGGSGEARAARLASNGEHADAANAYMQLASAESGVDRDRMALLAIDQWLMAGDTERARDTYQGIARPNSGPALYIWSSNSAAFLLLAGEPENALGVLEPLSREPLPLADRLRIEALRADAWIQMQDPARAVELMNQRESWLDSRRDIENNRRRLWAGLTVSRPQVLRESADVAMNPEIRGWLSLASLATSTGQQGIGWNNGLVRWRADNAGHPAFSIIDDLKQPLEQLLDYPRHIALLLPLSGRTASAGQAIQNGFLGAYFATAGGLDDSQTVRIYDVNIEGGASAAYANAVQDGAEFVVGPLLRNSVTELANDILVPVPILTLNYLNDDTLAPPGLYQFALAPEDEAMSAAQRAIADGYERAVVLVPNSNWGRRVLTNFATEYEELGGTVLDSRSYTTGNPDYSNTIEDLMALSGSVRRYQRLRANIGGPLQFDPRRRQDVEFIFLAADAPTARLLKSQLKFHYSGDLPVYSTSSIYAMDGRSDSDLNGVMFADTPWIIGPQSWIAHLPDIYRDHWPEERRLGRLHAMGYDAYHLVAPLFASHDGTMEEIDGATGKLFLSPDGRVHRKLAWAEFQRGQPVPLPDPEDFGSPLMEFDSEHAPVQETPVEPWPSDTQEL